MSELSDSLRLQIAQFNNFLIKNYLSKIKLQDDGKEPQTYLFGSFFQLSEHLAIIGSTMGSLDILQEGTLLSLKEAIVKSVSVAYLIEKAGSIDELTSNIQGINTANLINTIKNISDYGKQFTIDQAKIDAEIEDLKQDNNEYFNLDGTSKFEIYELYFDEAAEYLNNHSAVLRVKNAFKQITGTYQYFSSIISLTDGVETSYTGNKIFIINLLNTLTVLLMALSYIEPFFQKSNDIAQFFEQQIINISATQSSFFNDLS